MKTIEEIMDLFLAHELEKSYSDVNTSRELIEQAIEAFANQFVSFTDEEIEKFAEKYADKYERRGCAFWNGMYVGYADAFKELRDKIKA